MIFFILACWLVNGRKYQIAKEVMSELQPLSINGRLIGTESPPYVIAEMSANHNGSLGNACRIIEAAKLAGADAVKLQTYTPDTITLNSNGSDFKIKSGLWNGRTLYELYQEAHMPWSWHAPLFEPCYINNIIKLIPIQIIK